MLTIQTFFRVLLQRRVTKKIINLIVTVNMLSTCSIVKRGMQYVGSTVERFCFRWNNCKNCQREAAQGGTPPKSLFHQHFLSEGHNSLVND